MSENVKLLHMSKDNKFVQISEIDKPVQITKNG